MILVCIKKKNKRFPVESTLFCIYKHFASEHHLVPNDKDK